MGRKTRLVKFYYFVNLFIFSAVVGAAEYELTGLISVDYRHFFSSPIYSGQKHGRAPSIVFEPEIYFVDDDESNTLTARLFYRYDANDSERSHFDIRQLDWIHAQDSWEVRLGYGKVFWGVTESRHLVDIVNQTDLIEDVDGEDKLGQPMMQLATFQDWGTLRLFYLPYFRERTFAGREGRLRGPVPVDTDNAIYANSAERWYPTVAARYEHVLGDFDFGFSHFHGTSREPRLIQNGDKVLPYYEVIDQTGVDVQYTYDAWLLKFEALGRAGHGDYFFAMASGFEYTFYGMNVFDIETDHDLGVLLEYHHDDRSDDAPATDFDDDIFAGFRYTLNDEYDTEVLAGVTTDISDGSQFIVFETSRRLDDHFKLEIEARVFANQDKSNNAFLFRRDDYFDVDLTYYF